MKRVYPTKKAYYAILIATAVIVLASSLTALMRGKDFSLFLQFRQSSGETLPYGDYLALTVIAFLLTVLIPVSYALQTVFFAVRNGISSLSRLFWGFLLIAATALHAAGLAFDNIFFYLQLIGLLALIAIHASKAWAAPRERRDRQ